MDDNDQWIYDAVLEAVGDVNLVRESKAPVFIEVQDGIVTVTSNVMSGQMKRQLLTAVAATPNVVKVIDKVREDRNIEIELARAIAAHDDLNALRPPLIVNSYKGVVSLTGFVPTTELIDEAMRLAEDIRGVRRVRSEIQLGEGAV